MNKTIKINNYEHQMPYVGDEITGDTIGELFFGKDCFDGLKESGRVNFNIVCMSERSMSYEKNVTLEQKVRLNPDLVFFISVDTLREKNEGHFYWINGFKRFSEKSKRMTPIGLWLDLSGQSFQEMQDDGIWVIGVYSIDDGKTWKEVTYPIMTETGMTFRITSVSKEAYDSSDYAKNN